MCLQAGYANAAYCCGYVDREGLDEHIDFDAPPEPLTYHGHCPQTATKRDHHAVGVLWRAGYEVDALDSGCCGMADSFGDEKEYYSMSKAIAGLLSEQVAASEGSQVVAPGAPCRSQLAEMDDTGQFDGETPPHPVELLAAALPEPT